MIGYEFFKDIDWVMIADRGSKFNELLIRYDRYRPVLSKSLRIQTII